MKKRIQFEIVNWALIIVLLLSLAETIYFGWGSISVNGIEKWIETIVNATLLIGITFYMTEIAIYVKNKILALEEDQSHIISGKFTDEQVEFLEQIIHEDAAMDQIEAVVWCIDACKKIEEQHGVDACHVGFHGLPKSDNEVVKKVLELTQQDYRVEFSKGLEKCIIVHLLKMSKGDLIKSDHEIIVGDGDPAYLPFEMRLCNLLDEMRCQVDELIDKNK